MIEEIRGKRPLPVTENNIPQLLGLNRPKQLETTIKLKTRGPVELELCSVKLMQKKSLSIQQMIFKKTHFWEKTKQSMEMEILMKEFTPIVFEKNWDWNSKKTKIIALFIFSANLNSDHLRNKLESFFNLKVAQKCIIVNWELDGTFSSCSFRAVWTSR